MRAILERSLVILLLLFASAGGRVFAQDSVPASSSRIALVIGIGSYRSGALPTAPDDAGLVAQTLAAAGFDVTGARDLDGEGLRRVFREFLEKASTVGPQGIALVYFAGHALQFDGDNYLVPVDAALGRDQDVPIETVRLADFTRALAAEPLAAKVVVIDGAYADRNKAARYANGLALVDPDPGTLVAFNAAPGTVASINTGDYGTYAKILTRTMKQGGVPVEEVFDRLRIAVNTETRGAVVPWDVSKLAQSFRFFERAPDAPAVESAQIPFASLRNRPLRDFSPEQAYDVALARDTLPAYEEYLTVFPDRPLARRVRLLLAVRREALFWREAVNRNSTPAFWTYLRRYPKGPHAAEAQRRLARLAALKAPPPDFAPLAFEVPPPPEAEYPLIERRFVFEEVDLEPPPPPPIFLLPPPPPEIVVLPPPSPAPAPGFLPIPVPVAIPFVRPSVAPGMIVPPRGFKGAYPQPRPFAAAPANGGLVVRPIIGQPQPAQPALAPQRVPAQTNLPGDLRPAARRSPKPAQEPGRLPGAGIVKPSSAPPLGLAEPHRKQQRNRPGGAATPSAAAPLPDVNQPAASAPVVQPPARRKNMPKGNGPPQNPLVLPDQGGPVPPGADTQNLRHRPAPQAQPDGGDGQPQLRSGGENRAPRVQVPNAFGQPQRPALEPRPDLRQRPQPPSAFPPGGAQQGGPPQGEGAARDNRNRRPDCGHPGQPPCRP